MITRRSFIVCGGGMAYLLAAGRSRAMATPAFDTRGVVLTPEDLTLADWPERAAHAGLTTIALHPTPSAVSVYVRSERGQVFLERCRALGLQVEYELHAMRELLPRGLFETDRSLFRMDDKGDRVPDANLCVHSGRALEIAARNAVAIGQVLRPTTGRYFFWGDDGAPWCRCPRCSSYSDSDQALILENHLIGALHTADSHASLAHLAYANTLSPPSRVKPEPGVFLEFAPIERTYDHAIDDAASPLNRRHLAALKANLAAFGARNAQVLEYWLDLSRFSHWTRPAPRLPWNPAIAAADARAYANLGIRRATSFAVFIDADYVRTHGEPPIDDYGRALGGPA